MINTRIDKQDNVNLSIGGRMEIPYQMYSGIEKYVKESRETAQEVLIGEDSKVEVPTDAMEVVRDLTV